MRVALAGNPNCGKTSLFNALTGARQHVGNYPGVTVEKRVGTLLHEKGHEEVLDLPGTYSLTSYSPEERIAQDEILRQGHDVIVVVVDSTNLRRGMILLAQVMQTGARPVLCLNMADEARRAGQRIDIDRMEAILGFPVVETVGHRGIGVDRLVRAIREAAASPGGAHPRLGDPLHEAIGAVGGKLEQTPLDPKVRPFVATKLLSDDVKIPVDLDLSRDGGMVALDEARRQRERIEAETGQDIALHVTEAYYAFVDGILREVVLSPPRSGSRAGSDRVDSILVHRLLGLPIFAGIMFAVFWVTFTAGEVPMDWIEAGIGILAGWISGLWPAGADSPLRSLIVDGIIGGVGGVLVFLPNILLLFLGLALLEDTGYMARAAFLMDRVMHRFGLHGKSFLPMLTGFGCSIPGIMATRTLEDERDRLTAMLVLPLMSCGARLPIWMLLIPAFFAPVWRAPMLWIIYTVGIVLALILALFLKKSVLRGEEAPFVLELPPYRMPTLKAITMRVGERAWLYLRKAGTVILAISIIMWFVTAYPKAPEPSYAERFGRAVEPALKPLGFDWKLATGMVGAFAAKEVFVAQMGIVYSVEDADEASEGLRSALRRDYSPLVGLSLMMFLLIGTPCMATLAVTRRESGGWKWAILQFAGLTAIAYLVSLAVYQVGRLVLGGMA